MKVTAFDAVYSQQVTMGGTLLISSDGSNSGPSGGDVTGESGDLSVVRLRSSVSLSSNLGAGSLGDVLTLIATSPFTAQFATPSNSGGGAAFGSNSTFVSETTAVGVSSNSSRADHTHGGISLVTASSSNTMQRGTLNLRSGSNVFFGLTDSDGDGELDTITVSGAAGSSSSGSGALVLLEQKTAASSATLDFTTAITTSYDEYVFELVNVIPASNNVDLYIRVSTDGGANYVATNSYSTSLIAFATGGVANSGSASTTHIMFRNSGEISNNSAYGVCGTVRLFAPLSTAVYTRFLAEHTYFSSALVRGSFAGQYNATTAVNAVRFLFSSGNLASGIIRAYGIAK